MPTSFITLPMASSSDLVAAAGTLFNDLWPILVLAIGIPLAFYLLRNIIGLAPKSRGRRA
jgi:hypothetical protein